MARVTIEGSKVMRTDALGPGLQTTVEYTGHIRKLVRVGAVSIVDGPFDDASEAPEVVVPARNAKREVWAEFLRGSGIEFRDGDPEGEDWDGRDDLIALWDARDGEG